MTSTVEVNINEALALIDQGLSVTLGRELMSANEVTDMLLDLRTILASYDATPDVPEISDEVLAEPIHAALQ